MASISPGAVTRLAFAAALVAAVPATASAQTYINPVLDEGFADPTVLKIGSTWYAFATGKSTVASVTPYIRMSRSNDLVNWSSAVTVMSPPAWVDQGEPDVWAPHVIQDPANPKRLVMYFSGKANRDVVKSPPDVDKCLGTATATIPAGGLTPTTPLTFSPSSKPLRCGPGFRNIDPMAFYESNSGKWFLYWGSSSTEPIVKRELLPNLEDFVDGAPEVPVIGPIAGQKYSRLIEGSWLIERGSYRYIFMSGHACCGEDDGYAVTVARKPLSNLAGPWQRYTGGDNGAILKMNDQWVAPGHNAVLRDGAGKYWIVYHARPPKPAGSDNNPTRVLMIDRITWQDDWPRIANDSPSTGPVAAPTP